MSLLSEHTLAGRQTVETLMAQAGMDAAVPKQQSSGGDPGRRDRPTIGVQPGTVFRVESAPGTVLRVEAAQGGGCPGDSAQGGGCSRGVQVGRRSVFSPEVGSLGV